MSPPEPPCSALVSLTLKDQIKKSRGGGASFWLECKVATALQANVHAVRCSHSDQSLSTPSPPPTDPPPALIQLYLIHWIQDWLTTVHVQSLIITLPKISQVSPEHCNLPVGCAIRLPHRNKPQGNYILKSCADAIIINYYLLSRDALAFRTSGHSIAWPLFCNSMKTFRAI